MRRHGEARRVRGTLLLLLLLAMGACREDPHPGPAPQAGEGERHAALPPELEALTVLIARGRFDEARARAEAWSAAHPGDGRGVFVLGFAHHKQKDYGRARPYFERALALSPDFAVAHHFFGYCLYYLGEMEAAREQFEAHLAADPDESDSHFGLGLVELELGRLDEAEAAFRRSIDLIEALAATDPARYRARRADIAKCRARLADIHFQRGDYEAARDELLACIEIEPRHYSTYYTLSLVYRRLGEDELAEQALREHEAVKARVRGEGR